MPGVGEPTVHNRQRYVMPNGELAHSSDFVELLYELSRIEQLLHRNIDRRRNFRPGPGESISPRHFSRQFSPRTAEQSFSGVNHHLVEFSRRYLFNVPIATGARPLSQLVRMRPKELSGFLNGTALDLTIN